MTENRYFTSVPIFGRILATWGLDSVRDSAGNRLWGMPFDGWHLSCADDNLSGRLSVSEMVRHDALVLNATERDPVGALLDDIDLGAMESPLQSLCNARKDIAPER